MKYELPFKRSQNRVFVPTSRQSLDWFDRRFILNPLVCHYLLSTFIIGLFRSFLHLSVALGLCSPDSVVSSLSVVDVVYILRDSVVCLGSICIGNWLDLNQLSPHLYDSNKIKITKSTDRAMAIPTKMSIEIVNSFYWTSVILVIKSERNCLSTEALMQFRLNSSHVKNAQMSRLIGSQP